MLWVRKGKISWLGPEDDNQNVLESYHEILYSASNQVYLVSRSRYFPEEIYKLNFYELNCRVSGEPGEEHSGRILRVKWGKRAI